jgi:uncharacterized HhH-GPD family protein
MMDATISFTGNGDADALLSRDPQVPMEGAFTSPHVRAQRLGTDELDAAAVAAMDVEALEVVFREKPTLHRYPGSMAKRVHALCQYLVEHYDGDAEGVWRDATTGKELLARLRDLPGFGEQKARIFVAVLGKRLGVQPGLQHPEQPGHPGELGQVGHQRVPGARVLDLDRDGAAVSLR